MKILHISTYQKGGASMAAIRLHRALLAQGHDSKFLFFECRESDTFFKYNQRSFLGMLWWKFLTKFEIPLSLEAFRVRMYRSKFETFSFAASPYTDLYDHPLVKEADVVNLHWVARFVDYQTFFAHVGKTVVWTLHDMNPFQGAFHYHEDEIRNSFNLGDLDRQQHEIKKEAMGYLPANAVTVVAPSRWMMNLSAKSEILGRFRHYHIPYSIDRSVFRVRDKTACKASLGIDSEQITVLFVSEILANHRKGFDMIAELVKDRAVTSKCVFAAVGKVHPSEQIPGILYLGSVSSEEQMSVIYNAADLFIIPSREDNLPNTMIESLCSGTPVVGFAIGGVKDSVKDYQNGMLADGISVSELKDALLTAISYIDKFERPKISAAAHQLYSVEQQVKGYMHIYRQDKKPAGAEA